MQALMKKRKSEHFNIRKNKKIRVKKIINSRDGKL